MTFYLYVGHSSPAAVFLFTCRQKKNRSKGNPKGGGILNGKRRLYLFKDLFGYYIIRYIIDALLYRRPSPLCIIIVRLGILAIEIGSGQIVVRSLYIVNIIDKRAINST
jgi:hypothetical protein